MRRVLLLSSGLTVALTVFFWLFAEFGWSWQSPGDPVRRATPFPAGSGSGMGSRLLARNNVYPQARVSYEDFKDLVQEVEAHRKSRLLSLNEFLKKSREEGVIVLDTRSDLRYERIHVQGAKHLSFPDFTQETLGELIPSMDTPILIYCNNNFDGNANDFPSKVALPRTQLKPALAIREEGKPTMLALNVPTYITLYGYGYRNIYELDELVRVDDPRIQFEGTTVSKDPRSKVAIDKLQAKPVDSIPSVSATFGGGPPPGLGQLPRMSDRGDSASPQTRRQPGSWDFGLAK